MRKRGFCCGPVPVSVRPSVCPFVHSIQTAEDIVKFLCWPGSPIILVFTAPPGADTQFQGEPLQQERKIQGAGKFAIFDSNGRLSRKQYEIGPWLVWNVNDLDGPPTRFSESRHF